MLALDELKLSLDRSLVERMRLKSPINAMGVKRLWRKAAGARLRKEAYRHEYRAHTHDNSEAEVVRTEGKSGSKRIFINRVVNQIHKGGIPGSDDAARRSNEGFKDERSERRRKEGGGKEIGYVG
jgi:hypothetical protein